MYINIEASVECRECGEILFVDLAEFEIGDNQAWDDSPVERQLKRAGWEISGDECICDNCYANSSEDENEPKGN